MAPINGALRGKLDISSSADDKEVESQVLADEKIKAFIAGKEIKKIIVIKNRLVNIVVK